MSIGLSEQEILRREAMAELRNLGINPYPAEAFDVTAHAKEIKENYGFTNLGNEHSKSYNTFHQDP